MNMIRYRKMGKIFRSRWMTGLFFLIFFGVLFFQLQAKGNLLVIWNQFLAQLDKGNVFLIVATILLVPVNIMVEIKKWILLLNPVQYLSFRNAKIAILTGMAFGAITPARLGEYGGRQYGIEPENRLKAVWGMAFGSMLQLVVIFVFGLIGLGVYRPEFSHSSQLLAWLAIVGIVLVGIVLFHDRIAQILKKTFFRKFIFEGYFSYRLSEVIQILGWVLIRFLVYSTQFALIAYFLELPGTIKDYYAIVFIIFFVQSFFPLPAVLGLLMKSEIALFLWQNSEANEISIILGTFFLWVINVILPAIVGLSYLRTFQNKTFSND